MDHLVRPYVDFPQPKGPFKSIAALTFSFFIITIYESVFFYTKLQKSITEKEQLERENIKSQLESLKNQVNPHFLFNSLMSLQEWIESRPQKAAQFVQALAEEFRSISHMSGNALITMEEELAMCQAHLEIMSFRKQN